MEEAQAMYRRAYLAAQQKDDVGELASLRLQVCMYGWMNREIEG